MSTLPARGPRRSSTPAPLVALALLIPGLAAAGPQVVAVRDTPSSLSARYGAAVPLQVAGVSYYVIPSATGCEVRLAGPPAPDSLVSRFRAEGSFLEAAAAGSTIYLMGGTRGVAAVDVGDPAAPAASGSFATAFGAEHGAYAPVSHVLAVGSDSAVAFLGETAPGQLSLLQERVYSDGRRIMRIAARGDSFLVAAQRASGLSRIYLTLYRARAGAAPESLWDFEANGHDALDLAWQGDIAFIADDQSGVLPFHLPTRTLRPATSLNVGAIVALDADSASVVAVDGHRHLVQLTRAGSLGDSLIDQTSSLLTLELPTEVSLVFGHAIVATDSELGPPAPDEVTQSAIQDRDLLLGVTSPPVGETGRVRRVAQSGGYAYVADYAGGMRIYRSGGGDSTLVGVLPAQANGRTYDVALDPTRQLAFLASGASGLEIVDVTDPSSPQRVGSFTAQGNVYSVALAGPGLVAAGWVKSVTSNGGVTFVDVSTPGAPAGRGSASLGGTFVIADPRALAVKDTVLFVADSKSGVISVGFGNPDAPAIFGHVSGVLGTVDVNVQGNTLLAATGLRGVQVVDVSQPGAAILRGEASLPPVYGVTQQGSAAVAFLGPGGAAVLDLTDRARPVVRGPIYVPGFARAGAWSGDTLLVATSFGLERFRVSPSPVAVATLSLSYDDASGLPRVVIGWNGALPVGWPGSNLYRDRLDAGASVSEAAGVQLNGAMLPPGSSSFADRSVQQGASYRYRLEGCAPDGSSYERAEGVISIPSGARLGRPYPNPFRAAAGLLTVPFRAGAAPAGAAIQVRVFDVRGRLVRGVSLPAAAAGGFGAAVWDGKDEHGVPAASGLYLIHVQGPGIDDSKSVVLVR